MNGTDRERNLEIEIKKESGNDTLVESKKEQELKLFDFELSMEISSS